MKQKIYNLIILDESGSMDHTQNQTISGCNETIQTIKAAQDKYGDTQEHFVSIYVFQVGATPSRYLVKNAKPAEVREITAEDYMPCGSTPLNDAVGSTLADLKATIRGVQNATGSVTIITDGLENASKEYTTRQVGEMIKALKEKGWCFNFIGANIDVKATAAQYSIDNIMEYSQEGQGTTNMFSIELDRKMAYYDRVHRLREERILCGDFSEMMRESAKGYYDEDGADGDKKTDGAEKAGDDKR